MVLYFSNLGMFHSGHYNIFAWLTHSLTSVFTVQWVEICVPQLSQSLIPGIKFTIEVPCVLVHANRMSTTVKPALILLNWVFGHIFVPHLYLISWNNYLVCWGTMHVKNIPTIKVMLYNLVSGKCKSLSHNSLSKLQYLQCDSSSTTFNRPFKKYAQNLNAENRTE